MPLSDYEKTEFERITAGITFDDADSERGHKPDAFSPTVSHRVRIGEVFTIILALFAISSVPLGVFLFSDNPLSLFLSLGVGMAFVFLAHILEIQTKKISKAR